MSLVRTSIFVLGITLYLIVFITSFIKLAIDLRKKSKLVETLEGERLRNKQTLITVRVDRKNTKVPLEKFIIHLKVSMII